MNKKIKTVLQLYLILICGFAGSVAHAEYIDGIIAIVEDDIILDSELAQETAAVMRNIETQNTFIPPDFIIRKQVLERLIILKLQQQRAQQVGIKITNDMLRGAITDIARRNNMDLQTFREQLEKQGISYNSFADNVRNEIINNQLRASEIGNRVKVTEREIDHYLETQSQEGGDNIQYHLAHILIATPESATSDKIRVARIKAERIVQELRDGRDFKQTAITESNGAQALSGGDLGWRSIAQVPTIFVEYVPKLVSGNISDPIRSPSGFHIIQMLDVKGKGKHMITQTKVRHILIKLNELINDQEAQHRLLKLKERVANGEDFETLARAHSDDKASAIKGGNLDWISPGIFGAAIRGSHE